MTTRIDTRSISQKGPILTYSLGVRTPIRRLRPDFTLGSHSSSGGGTPISKYRHQSLQSGCTQDPTAETTRKRERNGSYKGVPTDDGSESRGNDL